MGGSVTFSESVGNYRVGHASWASFYGYSAHDDPFVHNLKKFALDVDEVNLGTAIGCQVQLSGMFVGKVHAKIVRTKEGQFRLQHLSGLEGLHPHAQLQHQFAATHVAGVPLGVGSRVRFQRLHQHNLREVHISEEGCHWNKEPQGYIHHLPMQRLFPQRLLVIL
jgi:hypothetical protein